MELTVAWWSLVSQLRPAFAREKTFNWAIIVIMGFCTREDSLGGVSSFVRCLEINPKYYQRILHLFASSAVKLEELALRWSGVILKFFKPFLFTANGRIVLVIDGLAVAKEGRKMPGVQSLHQSSDNNSKPEYIMGHFFQCVGILAGSPGWSTVFAVPLFGRIHLGTKTTNRDKRSLFDKALEVIKSCLCGKNNFYLVGDAYYAVGKMIRGVRDMGGDLIVKVRSNAVAFLPPPAEEMARRGRKRIYGMKVALKDLFLDLDKFSPMASPVYGEKGVEILVRRVELLSKLFGGNLLQFVFVIHPVRGRMILLCTDLSLPPSEVIRLYGLRFKIEVAFKSAIHSLGVFLYRFWMKAMEKTKRGEKTKYLHTKSADYRRRYHDKHGCYELYAQLGFIAQGVLMYLSMAKTDVVRGNFKCWFRTLRRGILPTELMVKVALKNCHSHFLAGSGLPPTLAKFIREKTTSDPEEELALSG